MYILQKSPDPKLTLKNGSEVTPVATLKDEYGGVSHIIEDDHCYVLVNGDKDQGFATVKHWYPEAVDALKVLTKKRPRFKIELKEKSWAFNWWPRIVVDQAGSSAFRGRNYLWLFWFICFD